MALKDLVEVIKANPGCFAVVDNDCWWLYKSDPNAPGVETDEQIKALELANSDEKLVRHGDGGYGSGNCYGGDILQALAKIVGIHVESV